MRRPMIVVSLALAMGLVAESAFAQRQSSGGTGTGNQAFSVGGNTGGGQGSSGNFGVGTAGQVDTNARYMRENRQGAFVGADTEDRGFVGAATSEAASGGGQASRNTRRGGGGSNRQANVNQSRGRGRQQDEVRVVLQLGFTRPDPANIAASLAPAAVASKLAGRMERSSWIQKRSPLQVSIEQGTATLRGLVATEHDRVLAERLAMLEGGVWKVENLLQVESPASAVPETPALLQPVPEVVNE